MRKYLIWTILILLAILLTSRISLKPKANVETLESEIRESSHLEAQLPSDSTKPFYEILRVVDGDTIETLIAGKVERLRLIGINTPETVDPRKLVECFGREASDKAKSILTGKKVSLENDLTQGERDKYNRLLRYIFLEDGTNFNLLMIREGYAYEDTYDLPYKYQSEFKQAEKEAKENKMGLWGASCEDRTDTAPAAGAAGACVIKGNINAKKEKIYHAPGCGSYNKTVIDESGGEKWFCSEQDALDAGWRKALNC